MKQELRAEMADVLLIWAKDGGINLKMGDFTALVTIVSGIVRAAVAEAVAAEREACCCDICFWCRDMRDEEYSDVVHEGGGAWIHEVDDEVWRCEAETIRARAAASAEGEA